MNEFKLYVVSQAEATNHSITLIVSNSISCSSLRGFVPSRQGAFDEYYCMTVADWKPYICIFQAMILIHER